VIYNDLDTGNLRLLISPPFLLPKPVIYALFGSFFWGSVCFPSGLITTNVFIFSQLCGVITNPGTIPNQCFRNLQKK
jgi:hypothetical protein